MAGQRRKRELRSKTCSSEGKIVQFLTFNFMKTVLNEIYLAIKQRKVEKLNLPDGLVHPIGMQKPLIIACIHLVKVAEQRIY